MPKLLVLTLVTFLHDLFTAVWIGGLLTLGLTVLPAAKEVLGAGPESRRLMAVIQRRLSTLVYISIVGLVATGLLLSQRNPAFQGLFHWGNPFSAVLSLKHLAVAAMIAIALYRSLALSRPQPGSTPGGERLKMALLFINLGLGVLVLLLSGLDAALAARVAGPL